ncbi:HIT zinc finger domain-containing protein [Hirsutella rhossiliensis]|uniref:HIT zinc finger domain-containing protein n=1 Tax=Hirsutella rhossiliensis TaxID=111463 RepID=A0A9P8MQG4_9HYPO|nr:HIT zinc finger domain-containing protein [Hirsutella rhossiliensis]KAH0957357.1 HIT zinc finger domain-containing protein [Hirsutella rhossiliensis]
MNSFGVIELAGGKTTAAPGWAYVPDTGPNPGSAGIQPANRKRARNAPGVGLSLGDLSARQEAKARKEVEALDRDGGRDSSIPLSVKSGRAHVKYTPNVRKIMQSQKTFANHLDDFLAMQALADAASNAHSGNTRPGGSGPSSNKRPAPGKKEAPAKQPPKAEDTPMVDAESAAPILLPPCRPAPAAHPEDSNPLLVSRVPEIPSDEELRKLLAHPPLTYLEARGTWDDFYPTRAFCEVCGYWGRVRCMKCGTRVCALDCLETHRAECVTRYGL